ncbi:MAG: hypothetical protein AB4911_09895 [Oscillochloridaceae bacterium umkhey_bin13]
MKTKLFLIPLLISILAGCAPAPMPNVPGPHGLTEPFLSAWRRAGAETIGPPQTPPLWLDEYQVQLFAGHMISAIDGRRAVVEPLSAGWEATYPADLFTLAASPHRASLALTEGQEAMAAPLAPLTLKLRVPGYSGPAELWLYDATLRPAGNITVQIEDGRAAPSVTPRGRLGPQWAMLLIDGQLAGASSALFTLEAQTELRTGDPSLDALYPRLRGFMERAAIAYELDGRTVRGYRSPDNPLLWLRDHVYQHRGFRYFETDVTSTLDAFRAAQLPDGSLPDVLDYPERFVTAFRKEVESDLEFLYVQGVYEAWLLTGDDVWVQGHLEPMRRAVGYIMSDPLRWDARRGLVRRPYTIDMWDFAYGPSTISDDGKPAPRHWIDEDTIWGTFHGDNTGLAHALDLLARIELYFGNADEAAHWQRESRSLMQRLNDLSWNGRFFTHFVPEDPNFAPAGVDASRQLSLSNTYALNREVLEPHQGQHIIEEYFARRDFDRAFAEWYSIDPPFPPGSFGMGGGKGENPGEYTNGGIMPLVGGELSRGAFRFGKALYGFDILRRYAALTELTGSTYLWYYPDGRAGIQGPNTIPNDGWGAGAMIGALFEGAAGFDARAPRLSDLILSPRWAAEPTFREVRAVIRYPASDAYAAYHWQRDEQSMTLELTSSGDLAYLRLLLPPELEDRPLQITLDGQPVPVSIERVAMRPYVTVPTSGGEAIVRVTWGGE